MNVRLSEVSDDVIRRVRQAGLDVTATLDRIRIASGTIDSDRLSALESTSGVELVEVAREVHALDDLPPQLSSGSDGSSIER